MFLFVLVFVEIKIMLVYLPAQGAVDLPGDVGSQPGIVGLQIATQR